MKYYTKINSLHTEFCMCQLMINWNPEAISQSKNASGYIVQYFSRELITSFSIEIPHNISYYEAWKVSDGIVVDRGDTCDDMFSIGNEFQYFDLFRKCAGTSGRYIFSGDVFWIPDNHLLFPTVSAWKESEVKDAAGLKSTFLCDDFENLEPLFSRLPFIHEWDLIDKDVIYNTAKKMLFRYCHSQCDRELLLSTIDYVIPAEYENMKMSIIDDWDKRWK